MEKTNEKNVPLNNCEVEKDGNIACKVSKKQFDSVHNLGTKPNRILFEIEE